MKHIKKTSLLFLLFLSLFLKADERIKIEQIIAKNVDGQHSQFSFFFLNSTDSNYLVDAFQCGGNYLCLTTKNRVYVFAYDTDPAVVIPIRQGNYFVNYNFISEASILSDVQNYPMIISWHIDLHNQNYHFLNRIDAEIYLAKTMDLNMDFFHKKQEDGVFAEIIKLMDGNNLSFALLVANHTSRKIVLTDFYGDGNQVKLKFPNGRIFTPPLKKDAKNMELKPGESKTFKIELDQLLKGNKDFSMKDFEYGLTELVWEIKLDKEQVITRNFWLVKFNGELPEAHASSGYKLDGPLIMETFRDKKISALPAPKAYFGNKEDAGSETKETSETKESSQK